MAIIGIIGKMLGKKYYFGEARLDRIPSLIKWLDISVNLFETRLVVFVAHVDKTSHLPIR